MCHSVIDWPFILSLYLAYSHLVSQLIKLVRLSFDLRYSLPQCFPEEKYDTLEYSKVKCYSGDSVCLRKLYLLGIVGILQRHEKNLQAHGYRCSFHPRVFQDIVSTRESEYTTYEFRLSKDTHTLV